MSTSQLLACVRHFDDFAQAGKYDLRTTSMSKLGDNLRVALKGRRARLITAPYPQLTESAQVLAGRIEPASIEQHDWLLVGCRLPIATILDQVLARFEDHEALIVVAGDEVCGQLPAEYAQRVHGLDLLRTGLDKGMARVVADEESFFLDGNTKRESKSIPSDR